MKKTLFILLVMSCTIAFALPFARTYSPDSTKVYEGIGSNSVTDIRQVNDSTFVFSSGNGLSFSYDRGKNIYTYYGNGETVSYGSVTGLVTFDNKIWVATAYDTMIYEGGFYNDYPVGNGVSYSPDGGLSWERYPQSKDDMVDTTESVFGGEVDALPITSAINNLIYDLAIQVTSDGDTVLWSANFAGGTRKSYDNGASWKRVVLPPDYYDSFDADTPLDFDLSPTSGALGYESNLNHRAFSVHVSGDTVVVGTANGINVSGDEGKTWVKYTAQNSAIPGNFVVDLDMDNENNIYAVCLATQATETRGLALSHFNTNGLMFWEAQMLGVRFYSIFAKSPERMFAAGEKGFWYSVDGWNWTDMGSVYDDKGEMLLTEKIYSVFEDADDTLWVGSADGVAKSGDLGNSWEIIRRVHNRYENDIDLSAYPNPFSPSRMNQFEDDGYVRIYCKLPSAGRVSIEIYDFSMARVKYLVRQQSVNQNEVEFLWNGKNGLNELVANGVYFIKLEYDWGDGDGKQVAWTKVIVLD
ncbi:MAG: two-component regulator propeller domain-containing protein [Candidatus Neomarinimicrobiota bacterium]